jgi:hypothetical protein
MSTTYESSVVILLKGQQITVEAVFCGEGCDNRAQDYVIDHPVDGGSYQVSDVEAQVEEHPEGWGLVGYP